jgi:hypothetical protein
MQAGLTDLQRQVTVHQQGHPDHSLVVYCARRNPEPASKPNRGGNGCHLDAWRNIVPHLLTNHHLTPRLEVQIKHSGCVSGLLEPQFVPPCPHNKRVRRSALESIIEIDGGSLWR